MNNVVSDVFLDNNKELLVGDKIVLESDQGITNDEKDILERIFASHIYMVEMDIFAPHHKIFTLSVAAAHLNIFH